MVRRVLLRLEERKRVVVFLDLLKNVLTNWNGLIERLPGPEDLECLLRLLLILHHLFVHLSLSKWFTQDSVHQAPPQAVPIARRGGRGRGGRLPAGQALRGGAPPLVTQIRRPHIPPRVNTAMQPVSNPPRTASSTTQSSQMTRPMASQPLPEIPAGGPSTPRRNPQTARHRSPARTSSSLLEALDSISLDTPAPLTRLPPSSVQRSPGKRKRAGTRGDSNEVVDITDGDEERKGHVCLISKNGVVESPKKRRKAVVGSVRVKIDPQEVIEISD